MIDLFFQLLPYVGSSEVRVRYGTMLKLDGSIYVVQDSTHHAWHDFDFKYYKCVLYLR